MSKTKVVYQAFVRVETHAGEKLEDSTAIQEAKMAVGFEVADAWIETNVFENVKIVALTPARDPQFPEG